MAKRLALGLLTAVLVLGGAERASTQGGPPSEWTVHVTPTLMGDSLMTAGVGAREVEGARITREAALSVSCLPRSGFQITLTAFPTGALPQNTHVNLDVRFDDFPLEKARAVVFLADTSMNVGTTAEGVSRFLIGLVTSSKQVAIRGPTMDTAVFPLDGAWGPIQRVRAACPDSP